MSLALMTGKAAGVPFQMRNSIYRRFRVNLENEKAFVGNNDDVQS